VAGCNCHIFRQFDHRLLNHITRCIQPRLAKQEKRERSGYLVPCSSRKTSVRVLICSETTPKASTPTHASPAQTESARETEQSNQSNPPLASLLHFFSHEVDPLHPATPLPARILQLRSPSSLPTQQHQTKHRPPPALLNDNSLSVVERRGEARTLKLLVLLLHWSLTFR
jgi:hypothetical protein